MTISTRTSAARRRASAAKLARVGLVGLGHVGEITRDVLAPVCDLVEYDLAIHDEYPADALLACDFVVVCVNTPSLPDASPDLSQVEEVFAALPGHAPVVLRSTVPPGTSDRLAAEHDRDVIFWPEYVGETRFALPTWERLTGDDAFVILGHAETSTGLAWLDLLAQAYGPMVRLHQTTRAEAELVKYMENAFFSVKTTFVNEMRDVCESLGLNWHRVRTGWLLDPRVERDHSDAFAAARGFSGKCLPKDLAALLSVTDDRGLDTPLLRGVLDSNARRRLAG